MESVANFVQFKPCPATPQKNMESLQNFVQCKPCLVTILNLYLTFQNMESLPDFVQFKPCPGTPLKDIFIAASDDLLEILERMLTMDPCTRLTASQVRLNIFSW